MNRLAVLIAMLFGIAGVLSGPEAGAKMSVLLTRHNLSSATGPGQIKALTENRVCVFCHTPHNANPQSPLWNKKLEGVNYSLYPPYTSSTMRGAPAGPTGATRLCLSCHDGTIALGEVLEPSQKIAMNVPGGIPPAKTTNFGTSLAKHHPVSFSYYSSLDSTPPNPELASAPPSGLLFYTNGVMQCTTCHDAHDNTNKKFLAADSKNSALCILCHQMYGWIGATHNTSGKGRTGGTNPWPRTGIDTDFGWTTVQQNGCENCHNPHNAEGTQRLLNALKEEDNCYPCHTGNVASTNIQADFLKPSRHKVEETTIGVTGDHHEANESPVMLTGHVECADCHNSHATNGRTASPPEVSGKLDKVSGVDSSGAAIVPPNFAANEYEICFKCHASVSPQSNMSAGFPIPRVVNTVNKRTAFQTTNPSYHPVMGQGPMGLDVPSIPSIYLPTMTSQDKIYCTDCHDSDTSRSIGGTGPRGSHGSVNSPLIRERYETADNTPETNAAYALCYRCHNRTSITQNNASFKKNQTSGKGGHSGHLGLTVNAPCSACHDPHGIQDPGTSGSHTHLINFDTRYVSPYGTNVYPFYTDNGNHSGGCTLVCHGVSHTGSAIYSYP